MTNFNRTGAIRLTLLHLIALPPQRAEYLFREMSDPEIEQMYTAVRDQLGAHITSGQPLGPAAQAIHDMLIEHVRPSVEA